MTAIAPPQTRKFTSVENIGNASLQDNIQLMQKQIQSITNYLQGCNWALSPSAATALITSTTLVPLAQFNVSITTFGNPVFFLLSVAQTSNLGIGQLACENSIGLSGFGFTIEVLRDGIVVYSISPSLIEFTTTNAKAIALTPGIINGVDTLCPPGDHVYSIQAAVAQSPGNTLFLTNLQLFVNEIN